MSGLKRRAQEKKRETLQIAFNLMNTDIGIAGVAMDKVAENAQVSEATTLKYFGSREGPIYEVSFTFMNDLEQRAKALIAGNLPFEKTLIIMSENKIHYLDRVSRQSCIDLMTYYTKEEKREFSDVMSMYTQESFSTMLDLSHRGWKEGRMDLKYSDGFLILYFQAMVEGTLRPKIYAKLFPYIVEWTEVLIKGIVSRKE